jgi:hypothetical protein
MPKQTIRRAKGGFLTSFIKHLLYIGRRLRRIACETLLAIYPVQYTQFYTHRQAPKQLAISGQRGSAANEQLAISNEQWKIRGESLRLKAVDADGRRM